MKGERTAVKCTFEDGLNYSLNRRTEKEIIPGLFE